MVEVRFGVEANYVRDLASGVTVDAFAGFGVPELHVTIVGSSEELCTVIVEGYISDCLGVTVIGAEELAVVVDIPYLQTVNIR